MPRTWPRLLTAAAVVLVPVTGHAFEECAPFTLVTLDENRQVDFIDHGAEGVGPGDQRIGINQLLSEDGDVVGEIHWVATVVQPHDDGSTRLISDGSMRLPTGNILFRMLPAATDREPHLVPHRAASVEATHMIMGGTGVFAGATGDFSWTHLDDEGLMYSVNVTCD